MSYSNVHPEADNDALIDLALGINMLQTLPAETILCVSSATLEKE